ncbi:MAG: hypothetical protein IH946_02510 [Bacteroidetes bacterium]|nr:hypothetical protein [Bacteroidota bacterium]
MLNYNNRTLLSSALTFPPDAQLSWVLGTTYTCSLERILGILLWSTGNEENALTNPIKTLQSLMDNAEKCKIYIDQGHLSSRSIPNKLTALLDIVLVEVPVKGGKAFHPKMLLVRYNHSHKKKRAVYKFIILSRNFTESSSWDVIFSVDCIPGKNISSFGQNIASFVKTLNPKHKSLSREHLRELEKLSPEMSEEFSKRFDLGINFYYQYPNGPKMISAFPEHIEKGIIISPFIDRNFFNSITRDELTELTFISTQTALDKLKLSEDELEKSTFKVFDAQLDNIDVEAGTDKDSEVNRDNQLLDITAFQHSLHAKLYALKTEQGYQYWLGSSNATSNGWKGHNTEIMTRLDSSHYSLDEFWKESFHLNEAEVLWINDYEPGELEDQTDEDLIDSIFHKVKQLRFAIHLLQTKKSYRLTIKNLAQIRNSISDSEANVYCQPYTEKADNHGQSPLNIMECDGQTEYQYSDELLLTPFVEVTIELNSKKFKSFLLKADISGWKITDEQRLKNLFNSIIHDTAAFFRFLKLLLGGWIDESDDSKEKDRDKSNASSANANGELKIDFTLEEMLFGLAHDPDVVEKIDQMVEFYQESKIDGSTDEEFNAFLDLWGSTKKAFGKK